MKQMTLFAFLTAFLLVFTWGNASENLSRRLTSGIIRLHILANSDSGEDQLLKLKVRDRLLAETQKQAAPLTDKEIENLCQQEVCDNGFSYPVTIQRGTFYFPRKSYENLTLPAGDYRAVRIIIGEGGGQNWWCVMYPPLCYTAGKGGVLDPADLEQLKSNLSEESFTLISRQDTITIKPGFKLLELWQELKSKYYKS